MIKETIYYEVHCDHCKEKLDLDGITAWESEEDAVEAMNYAGWEESETERVYCDQCISNGLIEIDNEYSDDYEN